jgi:transposase
VLYLGRVRKAAPAGGAAVLGPALAGKPMAHVTIQVDLPPGIEVTAYERHGDGHGFEVTWPWPERCRCDCCGRDEPAQLETKDTVHVVRDLDVFGQPSFWIYQTLFHRCPWCHHRQHVIPPFKRKDVGYTYRFEQHVLSLMIGSNEAEVARRLGIAAETVARIVKNQLAPDKQIDPDRVITDVGIDEISLKKRHKLYVTVLTDWTNPEQPEVLAVARGRDEAAGRACLEKLSEGQRRQVRSYRADLGIAFHNACQGLLPNARGVADRFHVAKLFNEALDARRKKNHAGIQGKAVAGGAEGVSVAAVGVPPRPGDADAGGPAEAFAVVCPLAEAEAVVRPAGAVQGGV